MNPTVITDVRSALSSVVNSYKPGRVRFKHLEPFKDEISDLRNRGAAFVTIAEILKGHSIKASREAVRQFYHEVIEEKTSRRKRSRNGSSKQSRPARRSEKKQAITPRATTAKAERGPRIARIEDL